MNQAVEQSVKVWDGAELFYRWWPAAKQTDRAVMLFHRGHEHSGRFEDVVRELDITDAHIFAWDARGHGRSPGDRGYAPTFSHFVRDMDDFVRKISDEHGVPVNNMVVVAHSVGAVMAAAWVHDYAPPIRGLVLATPAFRVRLYAPFAVTGLRLLHKVRPSAVIKSYVKAKMLTHDLQQSQQYDEDQLITRNIANNILLDMYDTATRLIDDAGAITVPVLMQSAGADWVVKNKVQAAFFAGLSSQDKELHHYPGMYHDILHEKGREPILGAIRRFINRRFADDEQPPSLVDAHQQGYTKREFDRLSRSRPWFCPRGVMFRVTHLAMRTLGSMLSDGVKLGFDTGFDSGKTLDYVYENRPRGKAIVGKWIDRSYLNSPGWQGIRRRKVHLEELLARAIDKCHGRGKTVQLLDVAAGPGRYALDVIQRLRNERNIEVHALLRDFDERNVEFGRKLAGQMGLGSVKHEQGDAFDRDSLASLDPRPNVVVVSGLYELYADNELVLQSLRGIHDGMEEDGYLLYTGQPWHPQLEFIARVLPNRNGERWVMRRRTQQEMDGLVRAAGFEKVEMRIDQWGIFTVSMATRVSESASQRGTS